MKDIIVEYIYNKLVELSDLILQRKLWLNDNNDTGLISSYTELMCSLFDDFRFDEFIDIYAIQKGFSEVVIFELNRLRDLLNNYQEKENDEEIINDPDWHKVVNQAQKVISLWKIVM